MAAGQSAKADHDGTFVWADASGTEFASTGRDQFLIRAGGGVGIGLTDPQAALDVAGTVRSATGFQFPDGSTQSTAAFNGWSFANNQLDTTSSNPLELRANGQRLLTLVPGAFGSSVFGGSSTLWSPDVEASVVGGGLENDMRASVAVIGGGQANSASGTASVIGGGAGNTVTALGSTIGGGVDNRATGGFATASGGRQNDASSTWSAIGGGANNRVASRSYHSTVAGGVANVIQNATSAAVGGGANNSVRAHRGTIAGGSSNLVSGVGGSIGGGEQNQATSEFSGVGAGQGNLSSRPGSFVGGGTFNTASGDQTTVGGGWLNVARGSFSTVPGGLGNEAFGISSLAAGQFAQALHQGTFVWSDTTGDEFTSTARDQFLIRATGGVGVGADDPKTALDVAGTIRSRTGGFEFPDGTVQTTAAFDGWSFSSNMLSSASGLPFQIKLDGQQVLQLGSGGGASFLVGAENQILGSPSGAVVSGGRNNQAGLPGTLFTPDYATISGGLGNTVEGTGTSVGGGIGNRATGDASVVAGGRDNWSIGESSGILGGRGNQTRGMLSTLGGGGTNSAAGNFSTIAGGARNTASTTAIMAAIGGGHSNRVESANSVIAGGQNNLIRTRDAAIGGGRENQIDSVARDSVIAGGANNLVRGLGGVIGGGADNDSAGQFSSIAGGWFNQASGNFSAVPGGLGNEATGFSSLAAGQFALARHSGSFVWNDGRGDSFGSTGTDQFLIRAGGGVGINTAAPEAALHVNGSAKVNALQIGESATAGYVLTTDANGGGTWQPPVSDARLAAAGNAAGGPGSGFNADLLDGLDATQFARADHDHAAEYWSLQGNAGTAPDSLLGTLDNQPLRLAVNGQPALVLLPNPVSPNLLAGHAANSVAVGRVGTVVAGGGGETGSNQAGADFAAVGGGAGNAANGMYATVPGGYGNTAAGNYSLAAGNRAQALHNGAMTFADTTDADFTSTANNEFAARATGGVRFVTGQIPGTQIFTGARLSPGSGSWSNLSDRDAKENIRPVNTREVLDRVAALPLATWNYRTQESDVRHLGPMAQDFHAAFGLGEDERHISGVDTDGVALAAIQGLNQKLESEVREKSSEIEQLRQQNAELLRRLEALEQRLK